MNLLARTAKLWVLMILVALLAVATVCRAEVAVPPLGSRVTDLTGTLSADEITQLSQKLAAFEGMKGSQVAVLIVPTTWPETIEQYSIRVVDQWKLGRRRVDDGVLLLVAKNDRTLRIEVGYGLEGVLPDATAKRIIDEVILPRFKRDDFAGGITAGIDSILSVIEGEPLPPPKPAGGASGWNVVLDNLIPIFIGLLIAGKALQALFGRFVGASVLGAATGFIAWLVFASLLAAAVVAVLVFLLSLFGSAGRGIQRGGRGGWPGGFGGSGGWGGGSGGFGGGGGGFGGGGASGRW